MPVTMKMDWNRLICDKRFGLEDYHDPRRGVRSDFQRDYDRLVFSSPFRRLQNKTQVFPLPGSIFVHNRLTHSIEVACVGSSLATETAIVLRERHGAQPWAGKIDAIGEIVAAGCLAMILAIRRSAIRAKRPYRHFSARVPGVSFSRS